MLKGAIGQLVYGVEFCQYAAYILCKIKCVFLVSDLLKFDNKSNENVSIRNILFIFNNGFFLYRRPGAIFNDLI